MAILDHFGYPTHPMGDYDDPLWYNQEDFKPWLEHIKDNKRLIIIDDSAASPKSNKPDVTHKKLQVTSEKIKAKSGREVRARSYKTEPDPVEGEPSTPKKRDGRAEKKPKRGPKRPRLFTAPPGPVLLERRLPDLPLEGRVPVYFQSRVPNLKRNPLM